LAHKQTNIKIGSQTDNRWDNTWDKSPAKLADTEAAATPVDMGQSLLLLSYRIIYHYTTQLSLPKRPKHAVAGVLPLSSADWHLSRLCTPSNSMSE